MFSDRFLTDLKGLVRAPVRRRVFDVFRRVLHAADGRSMAGEALEDVFTRRRAAWVGAAQSSAPYAELGRPRLRPRAPRNRAPIFVTGRFRSGSTLVWNIFRHVDGCTAYYEPFNERRWFDPRTRGDRIDRTHLNVSDYWREYEGLERLGEVYREEWIDQRLFMDEASWDPGMKRYIQTLVDAAPGRAVLQFNRVDFRLPWLRHTFPDALIVHLYRHPRDQWCSSLVDPRGYPASASMREFADHDRFYLRRWARNLKYAYPFLEEADASHAYELFYYIWRLSYAFGLAYAHYSISFERLVEHPAAEITKLLAAVRTDHRDLDTLTSCVVQTGVGKWREYASNEWFQRIEAGCETVLAEFEAVVPARERLLEPAS
jgi:sulfotransferase family protein